MVLGSLAATVRLQAGNATEVPANSTVLSFCAFAVDAAKPAAITSGRNHFRSVCSLLLWSNDPPTMTGRSGSTHGAATVKTPAMNDRISRAITARLLLLIQTKGCRMQQAF